MLKRKVKQLVSLLTSLALLGTYALSMATPASAIDNIQLGEPGYVSLHSYTTPTDVEGVYKVKLSMDVNTQLEPADIVFIIDNSGSMGMPVEDEFMDATGTVQTPNAALTAWSASVGSIAGIPTSTLPTPFASMSAAGSSLNTAYNWDPAIDPGDFTLSNMYAVGAWKWGAEHDQQLIQSTVIGDSLRFANPYNSPVLSATGGYRFEWMKEGLMEAVEMLLDPSQSGTADLNQVSVFAFGDGSTESTGADNNIRMQALPGGATWDATDPDAYNWDFPTTTTASAGHVWANNYNKNGVMYNLQPAFSTNEFITFNSNFVTGTFTNADVPTNDSWITKDNYQALLTAIDQKLVRRQEGTGTASGLQAAYEILTDPAVTNTRANSNKYVFLLTDGVELTNRTTQPPTPWSPVPFTFTESISIAANLKQLGVNMTGLGILEPDSSLFEDNNFIPSKHNSSHTNNPTPASLVDYISQAPNRAVTAPEDLYTGEQHLLRILMPLKESSSYMQSPYGAGNAISGSSFMTQYTNDPGFSVEVGTGYRDYVDAITTGGEGDLTKLSYYRANTKAGVLNAFRDFVKNIHAASEINPEITLGTYFNIYQMPGKSLFETTNGTAAGGGRSVSWAIPDIAASGGSATLTFYVKLDAPADQANVWQALLESFIVKYRNFHGDLVSKGLPQNYVQAPAVETVQEIDHRLDDSQYAVYATQRKAEIAAFISPFSSSAVIDITDVKAEARGKGRVRLSLTAAHTGNLYYQWQYLETESGEWVSIPGANASVFTATNLKPGTYTFRCAVRTSDSKYSFSKEVQITLTAKDC